MPLALAAVRTALKFMPPPLRERTAVRLFMTNRAHGEPEREQKWRQRGTPVTVAGLHATSFGEGPAAFLMHGWEGRGLQLAAYITPLVERGHQVLALDGPGHGRNEGRAGLPTFTVFLEAAIQERHPKLIVAHSLGAAAAIVAAVRTGYRGTIVCLAGPPETDPIFTRARAMLGLPASGRDRFIARIGDLFADVRTDDIMDIAAQAARCKARLVAVLAEGDEEVPVAESEAILKAARARITRVVATHRSVMWEPHAVAAAMKAL